MNVLVRNVLQPAARSYTDSAAVLLANCCDDVIGKYGNFCLILPFLVAAATYLALIRLLAVLVLCSSS